MENVQYRACLAINGGIQGTSRERLYDELGLHALVKRRWRNELVSECGHFLPSLSDTINRICACRTEVETT